MVTSFDISQEIFSIDMLTALKSSLMHRRKHVLRSFRLYGDQVQLAFLYKCDTMNLLNPIAYGILQLSQLQGGDFYPTPQKTMLKLFDWFEIWYT